MDIVLVDSTSVGEVPLMSRLRARFPSALFVSLGLPQSPDFFDDIVETPERHVAPAHQHPRAARLIVGKLRLPFAICAALPVSYAEIDLTVSTAGYSQRAGGSRVGRRKDDMTVIDPFLDRSQSSAGARLEGRELAMLRHDIRGALMGVIGGRRADGGGRARRRGPRRRSSASPPRRGRSPAWSARPRRRARRGRAGGAGASRPRRFLAHLRRRYAAEAADRGLALRGRGRRRACRAALWSIAVALGRMLDNLVGNALKFSDAGTVRLTLARAADGSVVFRVADEGPGLAGRGGRAARRAAPAQGLGLEIVRTLADRLGAELSLGNRPGGGVEAVLRFPPEVADERRRAAAARPASDLAGLRVLLAEDNPTNQMVASQMLRALNAEVTVCADGVEALERFEAEAVDLVVVDIEMPRLSGLDVIRAIRARGDARAQVPIVALTAYAMREHRERIAAAGANGLISKPVTSVEALGRGLAAHVTRRAPPRRRGGRGRGRATPGGPVIDQATYEALVRGDRRRDHGRAPRQGDRRPARARSASSRAALRARSTATASARPRTS